ncbi:blue-light-activated protein [Holospora obtusa F1]|uniref:histidine kinase n=1 Tax=Holospora obtusa F1 TaxID=1399147 RepID=W6TFH4_HOLOB|nr:ATP-binding protein [Holospora obtusa]ETZ06755.1 blue-light-activated protein [Holospora obtusa F1]
MENKFEGSLVLELCSVICEAVLLENINWIDVCIATSIVFFIALYYGTGIGIFYIKKTGHIFGIKPKIFQNKKEKFYTMLQEYCAHPSVAPSKLRYAQFFILNNGSTVFALSVPFKNSIVIWIPCYTSSKKKWIKSLIWNHPMHTCVVNSNGKIQWFSRNLLQWLALHSCDLYHSPFSVLFKNSPPRWESIKNRHIVILLSRGKEDRAARIHMETVLKDTKLNIFYFFPCEYMYAYENDQLFLNAIPCSAVLIDSHGIIRNSNEEFQGKFFYSHNKSTFGVPIPYLTKASKSKLFTELQHARKRSKPSCVFIVELEQKTVQKESLEKMFAFLQPFSSYDDHVLFILLLMSAPNIVPPQEPLSQRMELLGQVASGIVHDFNNLLTGMIGFCDLLLQRHGPGDPSFQDVQQIKHSAVRAARLIQHLLDFSKSTSSAERVFSLQGCVQNLMPLIQRIIGPKIFLSFRHDAQTSAVYGNLDNIEQMILNLAINARDAMPNGGSLDFTLGTFVAKSSQTLTQGVLEMGQYVYLEVKDTGSGIPPDIFPYIFNAFVSSKEQGTGLGLSNISKTVTELKGGIQVQTEKGRGSTFSIYLPLHKGEIDSRNQESQKSLVEPNKTGEKILLVEDEDPIRLFSSRVLREKGYEVVEARDGIQALQTMKTHEDIMLIITDVMMPGIDGPSLISEVQKHTPHIKALFVSGYPKESIELSGASANRYFLQKPFSLSELVAKIQEILKKN